MSQKNQLNLSLKRSSIALFCACSALLLGGGAILVSGMNIIAQSACLLLLLAVWLWEFRRYLAMPQALRLNVDGWKVQTTRGFEKVVLVRGAFLTPSFSLLRFVATNGGKYVVPIFPDSCAKEDHYALNHCVKRDIRNMERIDEARLTSYLRSGFAQKN